MNNENKKLDNYLEMDDSDFDKLTNGFLNKTKKENKNKFNEEEEKFIQYILTHEKEDIQLTKKEEASHLIHSLKKEMLKTDDKNNDLNSAIQSLNIITEDNEAPPFMKERALLLLESIKEN